MHILLDNPSQDLAAFEAQAKQLVIALTADFGQNLVWAVNLVDLYICPETKRRSHTLQIAYSSLGKALGRDFVDSISSKIGMMLNPYLSQLNPHLSQFNPNLLQLIPNMSQLNPNLSQLNPNLSQLNTNLLHLNPELSKLNAYLLPLNPNLSQLNPNL